MTTKAIELEDIEKDNGFFDAAGFCRETLSNSRSLAAVFDHTLLKPEAAREQPAKGFRSFAEVEAGPKVMLRSETFAEHYT